jgi:hopanoid biosynthesis associated protein HpnK
MKRLIVNADDFGFTRGVNEGIIRAFQEGILTSTTLMANGEAFQHAVELAKANPELGIGCHLAAVGGNAIAKDSGKLASAEGRLPRTLSQLIIKLARGEVRSRDIEREFAAQVERVCAAGIKPTHLDTHKHTAVHPAVMQALVRVASDFGIRAARFPFESLTASGKSATSQNKSKIYWKQRLVAFTTTVTAQRYKRLMRQHDIKTPDYFCGVALTGLLDSEAIGNVINSLRDGTTELMCHAGLYDEELEQGATRLKRERQQELDALLDKKVKRRIEEQGVKLISYAEL